MRTKSFTSMKQSDDPGLHGRRHPERLVGAQEVVVVAGYVWFYPDGTTALRDAGTCRITDSGAWEYENSMLTLIDDDGAQHAVTVTGVPAAPERNWSQRLVFDAGGFWEFVDADYERDC